MTTNQTSDAGPSLRAVLYDAVGHDREVVIETVEIDALGEEQLLWVDLTGGGRSLLPQKLQSVLGGVHDLGSLEIFDDFYRFGIPLGDRSGSSLRFAIGKSWIVTASERRPEFFDQFLEADRGETLKGRMTATALMASLLMRHLDGFREDIARVDVSIDKLDETILRSREKRSPLTSLAALRRKLSSLRTVLTAQRSVMHGMIAPDFLAHVSEADRAFLVEVNRVFERLEDDVARARETVIGSFELYASRVAQDTNQLVKVLTIATVITGVIGALAGVFGMNFDTPVAHSGFHGFLLVTGAMSAVSVSIVALAVWRRWV
jgi:Mg2+ and Co2+ transporter CorA